MIVRFKRFPSKMLLDGCGVDPPPRWIGRSSQMGAEAMFFPYGHLNEFFISLTDNTFTHSQLRESLSISICQGTNSATIGTGS